MTKNKSVTLPHLALMVSVGLLMSSPLVNAKVSAEEAAKLGNELTAVGAEPEANADGSIPAWAGRDAWPNSSLSLTYEQMSKLWMDKPESVDSLIQPGSTTPLFTITQANWQDYADKLTLGHQAMFQRYTDYKMVIYPSTRGSFVPEAIEQATLENATRASLIDTDNLQGAALGYPFPIPQNGAEIIWNHKLRYRGAAVTRYNNQLIVDKDGSFNQAKIVEDAKFVYANLEEPPAADSNMILYYLQKIVAPARIAGQLTLVHETMDQTSGGRNAWLFNAGQGRTRRAPNVGYDNPAASSDALMFNDQQDMFNGALDRFNWKLLGKKEVYIPYNSVYLNSPTTTYKQVAQAGHVNQDLSRYELHRTWVVEATLKDGLRHSFGRRVFYVDEDSWAVAVGTNYDTRDEIWRVQEAHLISFPMVGATSGFPEIHYDLQNGRYFVQALYAEDQIPNFDNRFDDSYFLSSQLKNRGGRR